MIPVSVVLCVHNGERFLSAAIDSILSQSFTDFELIIVDDGSTDRSSEIMTGYRDPRISIVHEANLGYAAASNRGISEATGKYIAKVDDDDIALPTRLEKQFEFLERHPDHVVVGSWADWITENGRLVYTSRIPEHDGELQSRLPFSMPVPHAGSLYRTSALRGVGGYKNLGRYFYNEDVLLMIDLARIGKFANIQEVLSQFRITVSSNSQRATNYVITEREIVEEYFRQGTLNMAKAGTISEVSGRMSEREKKGLYYYRIGNLSISQTDERLFPLFNYARSIVSDPLTIKSYLGVIAVLFPRRLYRRIRYLRLQRESTRMFHSQPASRL